MDAVDITAELTNISFAPSSTLMEIIQNVRQIISTIAGTVPMDRDFGLSPDYLDMPINQARGYIADDIVTKIKKYEPRAEVVEVLFTGDALTGQTKPTVRIRPVING